MNAQNRKSQPHRPNKSIPRTTSHNRLIRHQPSNTRKISENIYNNKMEAPKKVEAVIKEEATKPILTADKLIQKVQSLSIQTLPFDQLWVQFLEAINPYLKQKVIFLTPLVQPGHQVLKDGRFLVVWLKIIGKGNFINSQIVYKMVQEREAKNVTVNKQVLEDYLKSNIKDTNQTPSKTVKNGQSLKRSILKNSERKVQFGKDEILYPKLDIQQSKEVDERRDRDKDILREIKDRNQKVWRLQCQNNFLLNYLNIVEVYLLNEVELVGVLKEIAQMFVIFVANDKVNKKQRLCLGVIAKNIDVQISLKILDDIKSNYSNLCFLDLEGRDPNEIWINSIPDDRQD